MKCFICLAQHDPDTACAPLNKPKQNGTDDLFDPSPGEALEKYGPAFTASYDGEDACCGAGIAVGDWIRADGQGGWVHDSCMHLLR